MAFGVSGSFIPSTVTSGDPINITVNRTVDVGDVAMVFVSMDDTNNPVVGVTDSSGNDYTVYGLVRNEGTVIIAVASIASTLSSGSSTISVNLGSSARALIRASSYTGVSSSVASSSNKYTVGSNYNISWSGLADGVAFTMFAFPQDYGFEDDSISGWTQVFVTDDASGVQSHQVFRKEVEAGTVSCSNSSPSIPYLAVGLVLPYQRAGYGQAVVVL